MRACDERSRAAPRPHEAMSHSPLPVSAAAALLHRKAMYGTRSTWKRQWPQPSSFELITNSPAATRKLVRLDPSRFIEAEAMSEIWKNNSGMFVGMLQPGIGISLQNEAMKIVQSLALAGGKIRPSYLVGDVEHTRGRLVLRLLGFMRMRLRS